MSNLEKYRSAFRVYGESSMDTVEWLCNDAYISETELFFIAYDANLCAMPYFSTWNDTEWKQKQIDSALERTKDFDGEVWLDDVRIK